MKTLFKSSLAAILVTVSATAISQINIDDDTYARQSLWPEVSAVSQMNSGTLRGLKTVRGTYRFYPSMKNFQPRTELIVSNNGNPNARWFEACAFESQVKLADFPKVRLVVQANPWAKNDLLTVTEKDGKQVQVSWSQIENAPYIHEMSVHLSEEDRFTSESLKVLNDQLKTQKEIFLNDGLVEFDLSSPLLKRLACNLTFGSVQIKTEIAMRYYPVMAAKSQYFSEKKFTMLYEGIKASVNNREKVDALESGLILGRELRKIGFSQSLLKTFWHSQLHDSIFKDVEADMFSIVKAHTKEELEVARIDLAIVVPFSKSPESDEFVVSTGQVNVIMEK